VARNWLARIRPAESRSCSALRVVSPERVNSSSAQGGKASTTCRKYWPKFSSPDWILAYTLAASSTREAVMSVNGRMTITTTIASVASAARVCRCRMAAVSRRLSGAKRIATMVAQRMAPANGQRIQAKTSDTAINSARKVLSSIRSRGIAVHV
jgi:hypothetical protein